MPKINKRICKRRDCQNIFTPLTRTHFYCSRECFLIEYKRVNDEVTFPNFLCPECRCEIHLDFEPLINPKKWSEFRCPKCKYKNTDDDFEVINEIKKNWKKYKKMEK